MRTLTTAIIENGRATEWLTGSVLLVFALTLSLPGDTLARSSFAGFGAMGLEETSLAVLLTLVGSARLSALYINGRWRRSPILRMLGAGCGVVVFSILSMAFAWPVLSTWVGTCHVTWFGGYPWPVETCGGEGANSRALGTGAGTYFVLALFDLLAAYRASADYRMTQVRHGPV